jgi:hypothetical protein
MLLLGNKAKTVPKSQFGCRGFKKLIRLHYSPEDGVYPLYSKYSGEMLLNYVNKKAVIKYNLLIEGMMCIHSFLWINSEGSMDENKTVEEVIVMYRKYSDDAAKLNGAGEYWNWSFMWLCLYPYVCLARTVLISYLTLTRRARGQVRGCSISWMCFLVVTITLKNSGER